MLTFLFSLPGVFRGSPLLAGLFYSSSVACSAACNRALAPFRSSLTQATSFFGLQVVTFKPPRATQSDIVSYFVLASVQGASMGLRSTGEGLLPPSRSIDHLIPPSIMQELPSTRTHHLRIPRPHCVSFRSPDVQYPIRGVPRKSLGESETLVQYEPSTTSNGSIHSSFRTILMRMKDYERFIFTSQQ
jgi:hypothetical protein